MGDEGEHRDDGSYVSALSKRPPTQSDGPATGTCVENVGPEEPERGLSFGLRRQVVDQGQWPLEVCVDFGSSGPTLCLVPSDLHFVEDAEQ